MPNILNWSGKSDSLLNLFTSTCWPSWRTDVGEEVHQHKTATTHAPNSTRDVNNDDDAVTFANLEYGADDDKTMRSLRDEGYGLMMTLFRKIESSNEKLIDAQWQQFAKELYELRNGERNFTQARMTPNDIKFFGESYGSLPDQLMQLLQVINTSESPFQITLTRLSKANDKIPSRISNILKQFPDIKQHIDRTYQQAKFERMLDTPLQKSGGKNALTAELIDSLIKKLEQFLPQARYYDEGNCFNATEYDRTDHIVYEIEDLQASLQVIRNHLVAYQTEHAQETVELLNHGGRV